MDRIQFNNRMNCILLDMRQKVLLREENEAFYFRISHLTPCVTCRFFVTLCEMPLVNPSVGGGFRRSGLRFGF